MLYVPIVHFFESSNKAQRPQKKKRDRRKANYNIIMTKIQNRPFL